MHVDWLITLFDYFGIVIFAISGALVGGRRRMDPVGFALVGTVTGVGGGTLRDLVLGVRPVFWVEDPSYIIVCVVASVATYFATSHISSLRRALVWADAVGLATFAVLGTQAALAQQVSPVIAVAMGVMTATFGGIVRDVLCDDVPLILRREIYATAALVGAVVYVGLDWTGLDQTLVMAAGFAAALSVRAFGIVFGVHGSDAGTGAGTGELAAAE
ncbi:trimeric intracellular cation channel family protein [Persicimonas caeni]|uniref:Trimeric intracellular cation channel family protein n=1 Tax=Persicimonas caeni TaxID=2292766 RepID=A0A4Y6PML5_PERCE|nr:trimeric intracellular cation channel family protein [Persicimonas caeni]QED30684.1 trimeric intracellular cation channel family protein [Persicimonas caeni]